jgi:hypothetical protein
MAREPYTLIGPWVNNQPPPLNDNNLNKLEKGIYDAHYPWLNTDQFSPTSDVEDLPVGISYMKATTGDWPDLPGVLQIIKLDDNNIFQAYFTDNDIYHRALVSDAWTNWREQGSGGSGGGGGPSATIDGISNPDGDIDLVAGPGIQITPDDENNTITISSTSEEAGPFRWAYNAANNSFELVYEEE